MDQMPDTLYQSPDFMKKTSAVNSRLTKTEQKKMVRQTLLLGVGAIVLLVLFIFVIMPGVVRFVGGILGGASPLESKDTLPPQVPVLSAPVEATFSAKLNLKGYGEAKSELVVLINNSEFKRQPISDDGTFEVEVSLFEGDNSISTYAIDAAGNESTVGKSYTVIFDNKAPKLEITEPTEGQQIELKKNQVTTIKGTTEPRAKVYVNGRLVLADKDGNFTTTFQLQEGENKITFKAEDLAGNVTEKVLTVNFKL